MNETQDTPNVRNAIGLDYLDGTFLPDDIAALEGYLQWAGISLTIRHHSERYLAGIGDLFADISIFLSSDIVSAIVFGTVTNGVYDALKWTLQYMYRSLKGKQLTRMRGKKVENVTPKVHLMLGDMHVMLPHDVGEEKFEYVVDKMLACATEKRISNECYCKYDPKTGDTIIMSQLEVIEAQRCSRSK